MDYFFRIRNAGRASLVREYKHNILKRKFTSLDIWFNSQCLRNNLTPRYINLRTSSTSTPATRALFQGRKIWLREEIKRHYFRLSVIDLKLKTIYFRLNSLLHPLEWDTLTSSLLDYVEDLGNRKFRRLSNKISSLSNSTNNNNNFNHSFNHNSGFNNNNSFNSSFQDISDHSDHSNLNVSFFDEVISSEFNSDNSVAHNGHFSNFNFHKRFLNLSDFPLDARDEQVLNLGLSFNLNFSPSPKDLQMLAVQSECVLESFQSSVDNNVLRSQISVILNKFCSNLPSLSPSQKNINSSVINFSKKLSLNNLVVSKADKGNCLVLMDRPLYINKVNDFLTDTDFPKIDFDPTVPFFNNLKKSLNLYHDTILFFNSNKFQLYPMNPLTPRLYGLPKIHKPDIPIRPVLSYSGSPSSKLASWLNNVISEKTQFQSRFSVKNSFTLAQKLSDLTLPDTAFLVSFDVKNLFPSIPPSQCISLVRQLLFENTNIPTHHILNLCSLVDIVANQNFFQFNNSFYYQKDGLAMGSPLSPLLSEIFMSSIEEKIISYPSFDKILFFSRYVDDTLLVFNGTLVELNAFFTFLNSIHPSIQFTMEVENNFSIPFLDLFITRHNNSLDISIYHKPTTSDSIIPFFSNHPHSHKFSTFNSYFHRLFNLPLSQSSFNKELGFIKQLAYNNNFPLKTLNKIFFKHLSRNLNKAFLITSVSNSNKDKRFFSLNFHDNISYKIASVFKKHNVNISFKTVHPLKNFIIKNKDIIPSLKRSGVYRLSCSYPACTACYIGQTGRNFSCRMSEHTRIIDKYKNINIVDLNSNSTFANHIINEKHYFDPDVGIEILHICDKGSRLNLLEIVEIFKCLNSPLLHCLNDQINFNCLNFFSSLTFLK